MSGPSLRNKYSPSQQHNIYRATTCNLLCAGGDHSNHISRDNYNQIRKAVEKSGSLHVPVLKADVYGLSACKITTIAIEECVAGIFAS